METLRMQWRHWEHNGDTENAMETLRMQWRHWERNGDTENAMETAILNFAKLDRNGRCYGDFLNLTILWLLWLRYTERYGDFFGTARRDRTMLDFFGTAMQDWRTLYWTSLYWITVKLNTRGGCYIKSKTVSMHATQHARESAASIDVRQVFLSQMMLVSEAIER
jgi:hypothetical protein